MTKANVLQEECEAKKAAVAQAHERLKAWESEFRDEHLALCYRRPDVCRGAALGDLSLADAEAVQIQIESVERRMGLLAVMRDEIDKEDKKLHHLHVQIQRLEKKQERYNALKEQLTLVHSRSDADELILLARALECEAEAGEFLADLERSRTKARQGGANV